MRGDPIKRVVSVKGIRVQPYLIAWVAYYTWSLVFVTAHTNAPDSGSVYSSEARALIHGALLLCTAVSISVCRKPWFVRFVRIGAVILLCSLTAFLFLLPGSAAVFAAPVIGGAMGLICAGVVIPFVFIMSNTEKFYAVVISNILVSALAPLVQLGILGGAEKLVSFIVAIVCLLPLFRFKAEDVPGNGTEPMPKAKKITYFTLVINFVFAVVVLGFGKLMTDYMPGMSSASSRLWHAAGGLAGGGLYLLVFAFIRKSLNVTWNITFSCFFLAILSSAVGRGTVAPLSSLLIGLSVTVGLINMFYNVGIIGQKYGNMNHLKLIFWFGVAGGGFCILLDRFVLGEDAILIAALAVSAVMAAFYFIVAPILARTYFEDDWVDDSEAGEIARIKATVSQFNKLEGLGLAPREREVCVLLLKSMSVKQIAAEMNLAFGTVNTYYRSLYRKLGISSKGELFMRFGAEAPAELAALAGEE
jgi:DNA-binding CsgD family transcriptional regulator